MAMVLMFLTGPLQYLPICALGAILISAALGLFDWKAMTRLYRIREGELTVCVTAMLGVVVLGALQGILVAIAIAMLVLLYRSSRPGDAVLGRVEGVSGFHTLAQYEGAVPLPGIVLYRFNAPVIFFNAAYFKRRVLEVLSVRPDAQWIAIDGAPIVHMDSTGADTIAVLAADLSAKGVRLVIAGANGRVVQMLDRSGTLEVLGPDALFPTLRSAVGAHQARDTGHEGSEAP